MARDFDIGFLGGGQLARMSIQAAQRMGLRCLSLDPTLPSPAGGVAPSLLGRLDDVEMLAEMFLKCERLTLENEFVPGGAIRTAVQQAGRHENDILPGIGTLERIQDKLRQAEAYEQAGVPIPRTIGLGSDANEAIDKIGFPMVLKARFGGYDGKGTRYAEDEEALEGYRHEWESGHWLAQERVDFRRELAVMVFRSQSDTGCFPTMETVQTDHVCDLVFPCDADAGEVAVAAVEAVEGYGLFGVELFETQDGRILVNEMAPRPHNSGHYSLDWGGVSQFEQHVRLVMGLPCAPAQGAPTCMANLLGQEGSGDWRVALNGALDAEPQAHIHWYGKSISRPGRKMGHVNATGENCRARAERAREAFYAAWAKT